MTSKPGIAIMGYPCWQTKSKRFLFVHTEFYLEISILLYLFPTFGIILLFVYFKSWNNLSPMKSMVIFKCWDILFYFALRFLFLNSCTLFFQWPIKTPDHVVSGCLQGKSCGYIWILCDHWGNISLFPHTFPGCILLLSLSNCIVNLDIYFMLCLSVVFKLQFFS